MSNPQDKSGPDSSSEQPNAVLPEQENKIKDVPEEKVKLVERASGSGPNGTSEQP